MKTEIEILKKKDIPTCLKIILETKIGGNKKEAEKVIKLSLKRGISPLNPNYYILKLDRKVIGISGLYYDYEDPEDVFWIDYFAVSPKFQNQGFGTIMIKNLEKICRERNVRLLCVFTETKDALKFYEKNGFKIAGRIDNYYGKDRPKIWLSKKV
jgi:ribosomal protein S18 acetylase RimI-like enzyme